MEGKLNEGFRITKVDKWGYGVVSGAGLIGLIKLTGLIKGLFSVQSNIFSI